MPFERTHEEIKDEEAAKHNCCDGYVYYDGRCGDGPIWIHKDGCAEKKREEREQRHWDRERR